MEIPSCSCFVIEVLCPCRTDPQVSVTHNLFVAFGRKETTISLTVMLTEKAGKGGEHKREKEVPRKLRMGSKPHSSGIRSLQAFPA